jgi:hypothetical protein
LGKDRYKRKCGEGNEGIEYEDTTKNFKDWGRECWKIERKKDTNG